MLYNSLLVGANNFGMCGVRGRIFHELKVVFSALFSTVCEGRKKTLMCSSFIPVGSWRPGRVANAETELYQILATAAPCICLSVAIAEKEFYIPEPYPWFHSAQNKIFGLVEARVHAALAMPATLAVPGAIFQAFPALCPCEPRLPRGEMQAVPRSACSNTRLLPATTSQPPPARIRSVRKYNTGMSFFFL